MFCIKKKVLIASVLVILMAGFIGIWMIAFQKKEPPEMGDPTPTITVEITPSPKFTPSLEPIPMEDTPSPLVITPGSTQGSDEENGITVLRDFSVDLDGDGEEELLEVLQIKSNADDGHSEEIEGLFRITDNHVKRKIVFFEKNTAGLTGIMQDITFYDMDGDGAQDVFITIPSVGSAFNINFFSTYNYKKDQLFSFRIDDKLNDFSKDFTFDYAGKGILYMIHEGFAFRASFDLKDNFYFSLDHEDQNKRYESAWVEPVPVVLNEEAQVGLVEDDEGSVFVKVPLPVFGTSTADLIGVVNIYYAFNDSFQPSMDGFDVFTFNSNQMVMIGEHSFN